MKTTIAFTIVLFASVLSARGGSAQTETYNSGGTLMPEQAAYDVTFYDLTLFVNPDDSTIQGKLRVEARVLAALDRFVLDLDTLLEVESVKPAAGTNHASALAFERKSGKIWIRLAEAAQPGETLSIEVAYGGRPMVAPVQKGSWSDGFTWTKSKSGEPWLGIISVLNGADIWWPCKDHPSDEPDSMALHITVPEPLTVAANGRMREYERFWKNGKRMHTFHWYISTPVNNYGVTLNIAQYSKIEDSYRSINGEVMPLTFWVMPEDYTKALTLFPQFAQHLRFFERLLGPYPFRADKYGVAQTVYLGMEHQTIISYGSDFRNNKYGFDRLHFHELAHEWFANLVTAPDWSDWWLHEGIASYLEALYAESLHDPAAYHEYIGSFRGRIRNHKPVAPRAAQRTRDIYGGDIYAKGAWILHTLRYLIGKDALVQSLRKLTYPDAAMEYVSDGRQCHFATTDAFQEIVQEVSGKELGWFFEVYFRQAELPRLISSVKGSILTLRWRGPDGLPFPMPVEVHIGDEIHKVTTEGGQGTIILPKEGRPEIDPQNWILKAEFN
ncbi:MAG: M1 family metallopeptidase [bacterium]